MLTYNKEKTVVSGVFICEVANREVKYDNTPHHTDVATFPHHKHVSDKREPEATREKTVIDVVSEIAKTISKAC